MKVRRTRPANAGGRGCRLTLVLFALTLISSSVPAIANAQQDAHAIRSVESDANAAYLTLADGVLRIQPCAPNTVRVTFAKEKPLPDLSNPWILDGSCPTTPFSTRQTNDSVDILTAELTVSVDETSGAVRFATVAGSTLLGEMTYPWPRKLTPVTVDGESTQRASVWFGLTPDEHFYGLGQHQNGILNQRNLEMQLSQDNTNISVPFFLSSKGYGVLWNNGSVTRWNNRFQPELNIESSYASAVDYYFIYGPNFDRIIAGDRTLTGAAPLFPRWAYGFWQSKLAYSSQAEIEDIAARYRSFGLPLDAIVLDAGWESVFGSREFTPRFPDPKSMVQTLHNEHVHLMVSIWPTFQPGSANFDAMQKNGFFVTGGVDRIPPYYPGTQLYDAFNPAARRLYWQQVKSSLYDLGVDAFWMDSTEPSDMYGEEHGPMLEGGKTALGNGSKYANIFPLMTTQAIYDGQRATTDKQRVFTLTRSSFFGMQRNAAAAWSGDIATNFDTLRREIPAGLNYSLSGFPYWTTDIGGFLGGDTSSPNYRELFVRWFQYGSFCPVFRVHGTRTNNENELWSDGSEDQAILALYDRLRYRLLPYIYTLAARTTFDAYTPMRALAFDFRNDPAALDANSEFMLGPSLLAAPVTQAGVDARSLYLPYGTDWYDFWTGERTHGGQTIQRATPLATMPVYVRAGSILPLGPEIEYANQKPADPIELRVYPGNDADFRLYEDDGTTYDYEKGAFAWIPIHWDDATRTLTFAAREGQFPGMLAARVFQVVLVRPRHGVGESTTTGKNVLYSGSEVKIHFPPERPAPSKKPAVVAAPPAAHGPAHLPHS